MSASSPDLEAKITASVPGRGSAEVLPSWRNRWLNALALTLSTLAILLLLYRNTAWSMVSKWIDSDTFAHGFIIAPISIWLIWRKRERISLIVPRPWWPALILVAGAGFGWMAGRIAGVVALQQFALVAMLCFAAWSIVGTAVMRSILFPVAFLFFMVPVGDFLMGSLMKQTADFVVLALQLTGVPVYREGNYFTIPSGSWSVVEACSGLRYLIASITLGCLFAYLTYRSLWRRAAFIAASVAVPIVANWLRAYMIVMLAYLSGNRLATGVDHLVYGWLFFGLVMLLLFWIGSFWREDYDPKNTVPPKTEAQSGFASATLQTGHMRAAAGKKGNLTLTAAATLIVAGLWIPVLFALENTGSDAPPKLAALPGIEAKPGTRAWQEAEAFTTWTPHFLNSRAALVQTYGREAAERVSLFVGYYSRQSRTGEMVTYDNQTVMLSDKEWANVGEVERTIDVGGRALKLVEAQIRGVDSRMLVWKWYWIGGRTTDNDYAAKALMAFNSLVGRGDDSAALFVYTPIVAENRDEAAARLHDFVAAALPHLDQRLRNARLAAVRSTAVIPTATRLTVADGRP